MHLAFLCLVDLLGQNVGVCYNTDIDYGQFEYAEIKHKKKIKDKLDKKSIEQLNCLN